MAVQTPYTRAFADFPYRTLQLCDEQVSCTAYVKKRPSVGLRRILIGYLTASDAVCVVIDDGMLRRQPRLRGAIAVETRLHAARTVDTYEAQPRKASVGPEQGL